MSAFENAWAPFYFAVMNERDAKQTFSRMTTYGMAALVFLTTGLAAVSNDLVRLMTTPDFHGAAPVIPWIAAGVMFQGAYLLTSIGLNITKQTRFYPLATGLSAATSVGANLVLVPRFGIIGAAWANTLAYAVLAASAMRFSQRVYPMQYEWRRLALAAGAGVATLAVARAIPVSQPLAGVLSRSLLVLLLYPAFLFAIGFMRDSERARVRSLVRRLRFGRAGARTADAVEQAGEIVAADLPEESEPALLEAPAAVGERAQ